MRISDWSSDVCSSDLVPVDRKDDADARRRLSPRLAAAPGQRADRLTPGKTAATSARRRPGTAVRASEAYRPTCRAIDRKTVEYGKSVSVRVDHFGRRYIKKNNMSRASIRNKKY